MGELLLSAVLLDALDALDWSSSCSLSCVSQTSNDSPGLSWQSRLLQSCDLSHLMGKSSRGEMQGERSVSLSVLLATSDTCSIV